ncbi:hypothetical protein BV898_15496 [Hypsibius exemplaris]|uniref:Uncharacterized protein n=1 Tax=Hypsibius exemplaris TaxID=2072580 RepID=A0A9X6NHX7_HYPEX|nr:hypothetical protein BV898_15496 [Hypsibius exemplaris]
MLENAITLSTRRATVAAFRRGPVTQVKHGHPLSLQCRVKGFPRPRILWYKDGVRLDHRPPHRRDIHIRRKKKRTSILRIKKTSPGDSGTYRCVAVNVIGSSQAEVTVTVMPDSATESTTSSTTHWIFQGIPCQDRGFCQNEGVCSFYPRLMVRSCRCVYGFTGAQCEEQVPIGTQYVHYVNRTEQFNNGFQIFTFTTNTLLILLFIALIFFAYRIHRTLTSAAFESSASRSGSVYPGLTRQFSNDSRTQEAFLRVEYQHTSRHPVDERQSLLTVNHQTTIADNGNSNPNTAKCQPVESHAVPGRMKAQWKWPSASATVAMAADRVRHLSRSRPTVNVLPPSTAAAAPPTDQLSSAPNLSHLSSRAIGLPPYSERRPSAVDDLLLQTPSVPPV